MHAEFKKDREERERLEKKDKFAWTEEERTEKLGLKNAKLNQPPQKQSSKGHLSASQGRPRACGMIKSHSTTPTTSGSSASHMRNKQNQLLQKDLEINRLKREKRQWVSQVTELRAKVADLERKVSRTDSASHRSTSARNAVASNTHTRQVNRAGDLREKTPTSKPEIKGFDKWLSKHCPTKPEATKTNSPKPEPLNTKARLPTSKITNLRSKVISRDQS